MLLVLLILLTISTLAGCGCECNTERSSTTTCRPCGQYGFRCLNPKTFQICPLPYSDESESSLDTHDCGDGLICDEDNPAYCSPIDPMFNPFTKETPCCRNRRHGRKNRRRYNQVRECTTEEYPDPPEPTQSPQFECQGYGFYPDTSNRTLFWFCDVKDDGYGYRVHHMICGKNRVFDAQHRACVIPGTVRSMDAPKEDCCDSLTWKKRAPTRNEFSCRGKVTGTYPDNDDCRIYHFCKRTRYAAPEHIALTCNDEEAYDPYQKMCTRQAIYRCNVHEAENARDNNIENNQNSINCKAPSRFREVQNCDGYYLCYGDQFIQMMCPEAYKFDDNLLECLPEKIATCK